MSHHPCRQRVWVSQSLITVPFSHDTRKALPHWHLGNQNWSPGFWLPFRGCLFLLCISVYLEAATGKGGWGLQSLCHLGPLFIWVHSWQAKSEQHFWTEASTCQMEEASIMGLLHKVFLSFPGVVCRMNRQPEVQALYPEPEPLHQAWHPGFHLRGPPFPSPSCSRPSWTDRFSWCCSDSLNTPPSISAPNLCLTFSAKASVSSCSTVSKGQCMCIFWHTE